MSIATDAQSQARVLARPDHNLSRQRISHNALKVLYRLCRAGYIAYLVGGGVRDLLLQREPKDFDVATNARPEEIRRLFRNSRIIGRRFRLVHVFFRGEIVEVSTFRASPEPPDVPDRWEEELHGPAEEPVNTPATPAEHFGSPEEDAFRRDFTVNSLFYNITDFSIIDHVGGLDDLLAGLIRSIGPAEKRFEEDPVRMMRAIEYSVRLRFRIEDSTAAAISNCRDLIVEAAPARLGYELLEALRSGCSAEICKVWRQYGILGRAFPEVEDRHQILGKILAAVDAQCERGRRFEDATLLACLLLPRFLDLVDELTNDEGRVDNARLMTEFRTVLDPMAGRLHLANHAVHLVHHGLFALTKLKRRPERGRQVIKLTRHEYFPVTWKLFRLGAEAGLFSDETHRAWARAIRRVDGADRGEPVDFVVDPVRRTRRRRRPRRRRQ
ncbi:MAG: polynucleotide adenylyltransferase PcnB [bacterium]|nr:polynucleotide adenylyltransferase PcnB [bacterium]